MYALPSTAANAAPPPPASRLDRLKARPRKAGEASFFFFDAHFRNDAVKVLPGEFFVHDEDILVMTTLGSCIAACLWDREKKIGGMNHFLLPEGKGATDSGRYGSFAMDLLIGELVKRGATRSTMEAKVFGGGAVISGMNSINVGQQNTEFVLEYLRTERITVVSKDVLDVCPRKVCFFPVSGRAMVKRLSAARAADVAVQERTVAAPVAAAAGAGGSVELF